MSQQKNISRYTLITDEFICFWQDSDPKICLIRDYNRVWSTCVYHYRYEFIEWWFSWKYIQFIPIYVHAYASIQNYFNGQLSSSLSL